MKTKINSINQINSTKVLTPKQILLKKEISKEISIYGTSKSSTTYLKHYAERYRIGLLNSFEIEGINITPEFLKEYIKILDNPFMPLLSVESVILIYKNWKTQAEFIDHLISLVSKKGFVVNSDDFWFRILRICIKSSGNKARLFQVLLYFTSKFDWNENTIPHVSMLANTIITLSKFETYNKNKNIIEKTHRQICKKIYYHIDIWFDWITRKSKNIEEVEKLFLMTKIVDYISKNQSKLADYKDKKSFFIFMNMLDSRFSSKIILNTSLEQIDFSFLCFSANPAFFLKQQFYINDYSDFEVRNENSLILLSFFRRYHFPTILLENFNLLTSENMNWLVFVLKGNNIRTYAALPFKLSSKAAHIFNSLYSGYLNQNEFDRMKYLKLSIKDYLIYSQLRANELSHKVSLEILVKNISANDASIEFWIQNYTLLYHQGMKAPLVCTIHDYINYKMFQMNEKVNLKGKSIPNLIKDIDKWHNDLTEKKHLDRYQKIKFKKTFKSKFEIRDRKIYIEQILNGFELFLEGKNLHHCIFSYFSNCVRNQCSIFSLRTFDENENEIRLLTIEVREKVIYQIRGNYNRPYNLEELGILKLWAASENLKIVA